MARATYRDKQIAIRRVLLDARGQLHRDGKLLAIELKRVCAVNSSQLIRSPVTGQLDPVATACVAAKREVWDHFRRLLNLDDYSDVNLRED